jgi:vacuolar protein sorting-associated protein 13A/C
LNAVDLNLILFRLGFYERSFDRFTITKLKNEVSAHYQNQFLKQIHVLVFGLDVLGNPLGIIRGLAEGVESLFYEPYKVNFIHFIFYLSFSSN